MKIGIYRKGRKHSPYTLLNLSKIKLKNRAVITELYDINNNLIKRFNDCRILAEYINCHPKNLSKYYNNTKPYKNI